MAWNTGNSYTTASAITAAIMNGIGNDLRTWGGNVDGGGNSLLNLALLHVYGSGSPIALVESSSSNNRTFQVKSGGATASFMLQGATGAFLGTDGAQALTLYTNGSGNSRVTILSGGNFGIGTTSPTSPLQVVGVPTYASDAAAGTGGLTAGAAYKHSDGSAWWKL